METSVNKLYEAMFLVDSAQAAADWDGTMAAVRAVLEKSSAEIVSMRKWGDRRLAYDIDHKSRGMYVLCYFRANGQAIRSIEKAVRLSEQIMRVLILSTEGRSREQIEQDTHAEPTETHDNGSEERDTGRDKEDVATERKKTGRRIEEDVTEDAVAVEQEAADARPAQDASELPSGSADDREL